MGGVANSVALSVHIAGTELLAGTLLHLLQHFILEVHCAEADVEYLEVGVVSALECVTCNKGWVVGSVVNYYQKVESIIPKTEHLTIILQ